MALCHFGKNVSGICSIFKEMSSHTYKSVDQDVKNWVSGLNQCFLNRRSVMDLSVQISHSL